MNKLDFLRTKSVHKDFHRERAMFAIIDGEIKVMNTGNTYSHLEWFEKKGWVNEFNKEEFMKRTIRGMYSPSLNSLYAYKGLGFFYDDALVKEILIHIKSLKDLFELNDSAEVHLGPVDEIIEGVKYKQHNLGKIRDLIK